MSAERPDKRDDQTYSIIGAAMEVHSTLGHGFLEPVYQEALEVEFAARGLPFRREYPVPVRYKGIPLGTPYRVDFLCFDSIIVELKALTSITGVEVAQVLHYLKATGFEKGVLLNFGAPSLQYQRLIRSATDGRESASEQDDS